MSTLLHPIALALIGVISVARMARLLTYDTFPPAAWFRLRFAAALGSKWENLAVCPFCITPYLMAVQIAWFLALYHHHDAFVWGWLVPNLWWAASYAAAIVVAYDMPED